MRGLSFRLWALAISSAILQILPFPIAGPTPLWRRLFCWFCLSPLLLALFGRNTNGTKLTPAQSAALAYASGIIWYLGNCYWIYQTMHTYGDLPKPAAYGILLLFSLYVGLYHALFGWCIGLLHKGLPRILVMCLVPFVWVAVELARARVTGFPWDLLGYTQIDNTMLVQLAPWTGVMGLSFLVAAVNCLWPMFVLRPSVKAQRAVFALAGAFVVMLCVTGLRSSSKKFDVTSTAVLLQANLSVGAEAAGPREATPDLLAAFSKLSLHPLLMPNPTSGVPSIPALLSEQKPAIIAWPEAPADFLDQDATFRGTISSLAQQAKTPVVVNDITMASRTPDGHRKLYNSAAFFRADGTYAGRYDKMHLVPFGEYTPYAPLFFFAGHLLGDLPFLPGVERRLFTADAHHYGVFICYESIFGDDIRHFAGDGADVLVNISDDGWYGDSSAPWEHLDMVRMRAVENDRWIVRATNTGITAAIDPLGRVTATIPRHIRSSMLAGFGYREAQTFYTRHGDWFAWLCVMVIFCAFAYRYGMRSRLPKRQVH